MRQWACLLTVGWLLAHCGEAVAAPMESDLERVVEHRVNALRALARSPMVRRAVAHQNGQQLSDKLIRDRDRDWQASDAITPFKQSLMDSKVGTYLRTKVQRNEFVYGEVILTDAQGANVTCYPLSSDYWQGDEDKFLKAISGETFVGPVRYDESSNTRSVQISVPVFDERKVAIGVLIMGIKLSFIEMRTDVGR